MEFEFDFSAAAIEACYNLPSDEEFFEALVSDYDTDEFSDGEDYNPEQLFLDSLESIDDCFDNNLSPDDVSFLSEFIRYDRVTDLENQMLLAFDKLIEKLELISSSL
ncbi:hypothetical protein M5689_015551 [Euphorbia peplus]|nr:hypothetical protein M5689_015551 [Euphorbia peplus]